jgi:hypothetical protein
MAQQLGMDANELSGRIAQNTIEVYGSWDN